MSHCGFMFPWRLMKLTIGHYPVLIGHSDFFFGKASIQFCDHLSLLFVLFSYEFFLWSLPSNLLGRCTASNFFHSMSYLYFLNSVLWTVKVFNFVEIWFVIFFLFWSFYLFFVMSYCPFQEIFACFKVTIISIFSSLNVVMFTFTFGSVIHFKYDSQSYLFVSLIWNHFLRLDFAFPTA